VISALASPSGDVAFKREIGGGSVQEAISACGALTVVHYSSIQREVLSVCRTLYYLISSNRPHPDLYFHAILFSSTFSTVEIDRQTNRQTGRQTDKSRRIYSTTSTTAKHTTLHYTTLHYTTLHHTRPHYTTAHYTTLHYTTQHCSAMHHTTQKCLPRVCGPLPHPSCYDAH
jgi:hypothetical protein